MHHEWIWSYTIDEILADMQRRQGHGGAYDDEDRENEGDLIMAAECVRAEDVNFMARATDAGSSASR